MPLTPLDQNNLAACYNRAELRLMQGTTRQQQLERLTQEELHLIALQYRIPKPDGGWVDVVPYILEYEGLAQSVPTVPGTTCLCSSPTLQRGIASSNFEAYTKNTTVQSRQLQPGWRFTTELYQQLKFRVCPQCGERPRRDLEGNPECATSSPSCPFI